MTLIIPPGFGNAAFVFSATVGTPPIVTTLGFDTSGYGGDFVGAANDIMSTYALHMAPETAGTLTLDRVTLTIGQDGPGGSVDSTLAPINMNRTGTYPPVSTAAIARKVTNVIGRRGRGRMFLPGTVTESEVNEDGSISETRLTSLSSALIDLVADYEAGTTPTQPLPLFLFHTQAPADPTPIEQLTLAPLVGWIRGRIR